MKSNNYVGYSDEFNKNFEERDNDLDVWKDVFIYSSNLNGNWNISMQIFYKSIVPTAKKDPAKYARWINRLVRASGIKIKSRAGFLKALYYLRKLKKHNNKKYIKKALFSLFEAGLNEPLYALKAINNRHSSYQF